MSKKKIIDQDLEEETEILEEQTEVQEDSAALSSLKPNSMPNGSDPKSKVEYITSVLGAMHTMKKTDLEKWFHQAMDLIGKEASHLPGSANEKSNETSIQMKSSHATGTGGASANDPMAKIASITPGQSVREDVAEMFLGQDLSEEFKEKASTLFEAAIHMRALEEVVRLEEAYKVALSEEVQEMQESLEKKLDTYLDYVVEAWMKENEVAIESSLRNEVTEEFIGGLKNLFTEHYIDVPQEKVDVIESLAAKVVQLESKLNNVISENSELKGDLTVVQRNEIIEQVAESLTMTETEKFNALAESIQFDGDLDVFTKKLSYIKESYFPAQKSYVSNIISESFEGEDGEHTVINSPEVNRYVQAISRTVKK